MAEIFIPVLHYFENDNIFTGSSGDLRFRIQPTVVMATPKEVNMEASSIMAEYWYGEKCYELSRMEGQETFPMSQEGRSALKAWLESKA